MVQKKKVEKKTTKKEERYQANLEQLFNVLDTTVDQGRNLDALYGELVHFAEAGYFNDMRTTPLLIQYQMNNLTNTFVLEAFKESIKREIQKTK